MVPRIPLFLRFSIPRRDWKGDTPEIPYPAPGLQSNSDEVCPFPNNAPIALWTDKAAHDCQPSGLQQQHMTHPSLQVPAELVNPSRTSNRPVRGRGILWHQVRAGSRTLAAGRTQISSVSQTGFS